MRATRIKPVTALAAVLVASSGFAASSRVTLITTGDASRSAAFTTSLRELLGRLDVSLDGTEGPALAAVEADFTEPHVKLTVVDSAGRQVLVRRMPPSATTALQAEAAAHVVHSIIEELLVTPAPVPPDPEPPEPARPPLVETKVEAPPQLPDDRHFGIDVGGFFGGKAMGGPPATAGGGLDLAFSYRVGRFRPALHLAGGYDAPFVIESSWLDLRVSNVPLRALVSLDVLRGDSWRVEAALGGGADLFVTNPTGMALPPHLLKPRLGPAPVLSARISGHIALASSVDLLLALAADVDLRPPRFVTDDRQEIFLPWRVRPSLVIGFSFNFLGPDPYRGRLGGEL